MDWTAFFSGAGGAGVLAIILKLIDIYSVKPKVAAETKLINSEEKENAAETASKAVTTLGQVLDELQEDRKDLRQENAEYKTLIKELKAGYEKQTSEIRELQNHRDERTRQIDELTESNEALTSQVAALRAQIAKDTNETRELLEKYRELKEFTSYLLDFLEKKGVDLKELNGRIPDSISKLRGLKP
jgi:chromosome segregation ATPase